MIGRDTVVVGVAPRISKETFCRVLREAGSPAAGEGEAGYEAVARYGVDPAFALAVFKHESRYGTAGVCAQYDTKNPGNTRSTRTGVGEVILTPRGRFVRYPSWAEGWRDLAYRLADPTYVYAGRGLVTIAQIVPVWAPAADGNAPERYIEAVVEAMNEYVAMEGETVRQPRVALTAGHHNRDGGNQLEIELTGLLTRAYARAFRQLGADVRVITPDEGMGFFPGGLQDAARQVVEFARAGWVADLYLEPHTEAGPRGVFGIFPDWGGDVDVDARDRVIPAMVKAIAEASGLPIRQVAGMPPGVMSERQTGVGARGYRLGIFLATEPVKATTTRLIVEHGAHTQPADLAILRTPGMIDRIAMAGARAALEALGFAVASLAAEEIAPGTWRDEGERRVYNVGGALRTVAGGFLAYLRHIEGLLGPSDTLALIGYPLTDEVSEGGRVVQYFERAVFEWHPGARPARWDVLLRRLGAEAARAAGYRGPGID